MFSAKLKHRCLLLNFCPRTAKGSSFELCKQNIAFTFNRSAKAFVQRRWRRCTNDEQSTFGGWRKGCWGKSASAQGPCEQMRERTQFMEKELKQVERRERKEKGHVGDSELKQGVLLQVIFEVRKRLSCPKRAREFLGGMAALVKD